MFIKIQDNLIIFYYNLQEKWQLQMNIIYLFKPPTNLA